MRSKVLVILQPFINWPLLLILESAMEVFAGFIALGLFVYLLYVLIKPEAF